MKKIILIICCMLTACVFVEHTDLGKNVKGEMVKRTVCTGHRWLSQADCLEKARKKCPFKISATASKCLGCAEVLYICADENKENVQ